MFQSCVSRPLTLLRMLPWKILTWSFQRLCVARDVGIACGQARTQQGEVWNAIWTSVCGGNAAHPHSSQRKPRSTPHLLHTLWQLIHCSETPRPGSAHQLLTNPRASTERWKASMLFTHQPVALTSLSFSYWGISWLKNLNSPSSRKLATFVGEKGQARPLEKF